MPLDNNAKIGDIITALGGMQGINQKAELASVIGAPATASDNVATQITKIQSAKDVFASKIGVPNTTPLQAMADGLVVGGKKASGTITASTAGLPFSQGSGGTINRSYVEIAGLDFVPSKIELIRDGNTKTDYNSEGYRTYDIPNLKISMNIINAGDSTVNVVGILLTGNAYVNSTGFRLPVLSGGASYKWFAYE